ncbi:MAG TPA: shikimate dehydrogenase [Candidatus Binataceae bacterium]|nr:shikimate dehydrogenase [Candidatus Binataceae bacterium]
MTAPREHELSGRTRFTAIFGDPVEHSLSPAMHNAAYAALGLDRAYAAFHVTPASLREAVRAIPALGIAGVNLTVPHKERAARMMAELSEEARTLRAINCVVNRESRLYGDNTDARGLAIDLRDSGVVLEGRSALIVGAGGAAAAAVLACLRTGAAQIVLCNRTPERAARLARRLNRWAVSQGEGRSRHPIDARGLDALTERSTFADTALVINATPTGLKTGGFTKLAYGAAPDDCVFYDMIYAREPTPFLARALALGRRALDGAGMLVNQGELAFELFNRLAPPAGVMRGALMAALGRS